MIVILVFEDTWSSDNISQTVMLCGEIQMQQIWLFTYQFEVLNRIISFLQ